MADLPRVSVLMTAFNSAPYIGVAIQSVINQSMGDWELIIGDDASTDNTREIMARFNDPRIRSFHNSTNIHYLRTRNKLLSHVRGEFVALLDADDWYSPEKLELQIKAFEADPALALCGTLVIYVNKSGDHINTLDKKPLSYEEIKSRITTESTFTGSSIMVKTAILKEFGGYRDFFNGIGFEDYDLTSRIVEKYKAVNIPHATYAYRQYQESSSRKDLLSNPYKLHGHWLIRYFIQQRAASGKDSLDKNDLTDIERFMKEKNQPYVNDPSLIHREVMWSYLHRKMTGIAFTHAWTAVRTRPFQWSNWKAFILLLLISSGLRRF